MKPLLSAICVLQEWNLILPGAEGCRLRHVQAWLCATFDVQVVLKGSGYAEQVCGVELGRTRRGVVFGIQHLVNFEV